MPGTELILPDDDGRLELPPARHEGARQLWDRASRLSEWLPQGVAARQFIMAVSAEVNRNDLAECAPASVVSAAFNCAVLGLLPGSVLGHAHLIPFKGQCQLIIGYKGFLELAYGSDFLRDVQCEVVLKGERYRRWNDASGAQLEHEIPIDRKETWENVQAAYCVWHARGGGHGVVVVPRGALAKLKKRGNVWNSEPIAMCLKTPLRRAAKTWQLTHRMGAAVTLDDLAEAGKPQPALAGQDDPTDPPPSLDSFDDAPETSKADGPQSEDVATTEAKPAPDGELFDNSPEYHWD